MKVFTQSYGLPKLRESQFREFRDSNLGVLEQNDIWVLTLWLSTNNTVRGNVMASLSLGHDEFCEFVFAHGSSLHQKCFNYALINLLFGLCMSLWVSDLLVKFPSPYLRAPACPFTLKVLWARKHTPTPHSSVVFTLDSHFNLLRSLGVHWWWLLLFQLECIILCESFPYPMMGLQYCINNEKFLGLTLFIAWTSSLNNYPKVAFPWSHLLIHSSVQISLVIPFVSIMKTTIILVTL